MIIDTHAHLNFNAFKKDAEKVIRRSLTNNIWMINVGSQYDTSQRAIEIAKHYPEGVFAAVGLHPIHLETSLVKIKDDKEEIEIKTKEEDFNYEKYKVLAQAEKGVAIGEVGLDYYWKPKSKNQLEPFKEKQKEILTQQLELAKELNLPLIFHCRMAHRDLIEILKKQKNIKGVIHCFTGNLDEAQEYISLGLHLGFNGIIFKTNLDEVIKTMPLEKMLLETDCPYLSPPGAPRRNEPIYVKQVAEKIAGLKSMQIEELAKITTQNAKKLFLI